MAEAGWTLDELVARVATVLAEEPDQPSGRVRAVPDRRAIRWYTTIGLLDRPRLRGRTGWYGRRHLLQLVATKRLQAGGMPLARIQAELTGATDARLRDLAGLRDDQIDGSTATSGSGSPVRPRFWAAGPTATGPTATGLAATAPAAAERGSGAQLRYAVQLADGVTLLLDPPPSGGPDISQDISAVHAAARPLLHQLARLGLARAVPEEDTS